MGKMLMSCKNVKIWVEFYKLKFIAKTTLFFCNTKLEYAQLAFLQQTMNYKFVLLVYYRKKHVSSWKLINEGDVRKVLIQYLNFMNQIR